MITPEGSRVFIASKRAPKVEAVKAVFIQIKDLLLAANQIEFISSAVPSDVSEMPLSISEMMAGAYNRVQNMRNQTKPRDGIFDFFVGMEGGLFRQKQASFGEAYYLQSWVYVADARRGSFGASGAVPVPRPAIDRIVKHGEELGSVIDELGEADDVRNNEGAFGVFTRGLMTRQKIFEIALINALAPFYNQRLYQ